MRKTERKKLLIIGEAFYPEDFIINDLVQEWEREGKQVEVLTRAPSYPYGRVYSGYKNKIYQTTFFRSIKVHRFPVIQGYEKSVLIKILNYFSFIFWSCMVVLFIGRRFDKVFVYQTGPLTLATAAIVMKKIYGSKVSVWTQDLWPETVYAYGFKKTKVLSFLLDSFVKWIYVNSDHIFVSCEGFIKRLRRYAPEKRIDFIPNWSLVKYEPKGILTLPGKFNFTFAGNVGQVQNLESVIEGFGKFVVNHSDVCLNIIGDGSFLPDLKEYVKVRNIPQINFTGRKKISEMSDYYEASDVLILSLKDVPLYEIMIPSKFQAYLATGKPIFAIMKGEVACLVKSYGLGITANPSDTDDIAKGFESILSFSRDDFMDIEKKADSLLTTVFDRGLIIKKINSIVFENEK